MSEMIQPCVRCGGPAGIHMAFNYGDRTIWLDDLREPTIPGAGYAMCEDHAGRMTPPVGWTLIDRRQPVRPLFTAVQVA